MVLTGLVNSLIAYCLPRGQKLPVTFMLSSTDNRHPLGQIIHVNSFIIIDDGVGCELGTLSRKNLKTHFGMRNMKLFAKAAGGKIEFLSAPDEGMQVRLTIKLEG